MMKRKRTTRGFTLVEVLLVIAILGVLAGVFAFTVGGRLGKSKIDTTGLLLEQIVSKLGEYSIDIGHYPGEDEGGLSALVSEPTFDDEGLVGKWAGPYINRKQLKDPWGHDYIYKRSGEDSKTVFRLSCWGPDGEEGTEDDITCSTPGNSA